MNPSEDRQNPAKSPVQLSTSKLSCTDAYVSHKVSVSAASPAPSANKSIREIYRNHPWQSPSDRMSAFRCVLKIEDANAQVAKWTKAFQGWVDRNTSGK